MSAEGAGRPGFGRRAGARLAVLPLMALAALAAAGGPAARADYYEGRAAYEREDFRTAFAELEPPAQAGDPRAQLLLGRLYADGEGVVQNFVRAHMWLNLAASGGEAGAAEARDDLARRMTAEQLAEAQRLALEWRPVPPLATGYPPVPGEIAGAAPAANAAEIGPVFAPAAAQPLTPRQVTDLQWALAVHGYDPGPADGVVGPRTRAAIGRYQADAGLPVDGAASQALLDHLRFASGASDFARSDSAEEISDPVDTGFDDYGDDSESGHLDGRPTIETEDLGGSDVTVYGDPWDGAAFDSGAASGADAPGDEMERAYTVAVQQALADRGYEPGAADGFAGPRTRAAIRRYQSDMGLPADGHVSLALVNHLLLVGSPEARAY